MAPARPRALPRARRIRKRADFVRIQSGGHRVITRHLVLLVAAPARQAAGARHNVASAPSGRLGLVASRKVGGAVARNRAKRLVREAFRLQPELFPERVDVVVILRSGAGELDLDEVVAELRSVTPVLRRRAREALADAAGLESHGVEASRG